MDNPRNEAITDGAWFHREEGKDTRSTEGHPREAQGWGKEAPGTLGEGEDSGRTRGCTGEAGLLGSRNAFRYQDSRGIRLRTQEDKASPEVRQDGFQGGRGLEGSIEEADSITKEDDTFNHGTGEARGGWKPWAGKAMGRKGTGEARETQVIH